MTLKTMIAASAVALTVATGAMADSNFTGAYLGGNVGYGFGSLKVSDDFGPITTNNDMSLTGFVGGLHGGYQHQLGMFVVGAEASANLSNTKGSGSLVVDGAASTFVSVKRKNAFGLAARLGVAVNSWMVYTKLGWENAKFDFSSSETIGAVTTDAKANKRVNAFVAGLGFETVVADHVMLGGEWTTSFYKSKKISDDAVKKLRIGDFKVRLGYKF